MEAFLQKKMTDLLRDFYTLTGIKICVYDKVGNELCYYPAKFSPFCALLRGDPSLDARCRACDRHALIQCKKTHEQYVYTCHAGLTECVSPILVGESIVGYIVVGQIKADKSADFAKIADSLPVALREELSQEFERLPVIGHERLGAAMRILDACAGYEHLKRLVNTSDRQIDTLLERYIHEHLREDLSASLLRAEFHLSHHELYTLFRDYFHTTPAEYIKARRLKQACRLLTTTDLAVSAIARECGIPDYNYFSKIFKREVGTSPRDYRRRSREGDFPEQIEKDPDA